MFVSNDTTDFKNISKLRCQPVNRLLQLMSSFKSPIIQLLGHDWKGMLRSPFWQKSIWVNILLGLMSLYLLFFGAMMGYFVDDLIREVYKDTNVINAFIRVLFYYFIMELMIRFILQKLPVISIQPYMTLPVKKLTLLNYPLLKTFPSFFNILSVLLTLPFVIKVVTPASSAATSLSWCMIIFSMVIINNFLCFTLKKYLVKRPFIILLIITVIAALLYLEVEGRIRISSGFESAFLYITGRPALAVIPVFLAALTYLLAYALLKRNSYIEEEKIMNRKRSVDLSFLSRYGETGSLIRNELRLIMRNRRPRLTVIIGLLFMLYGFMLTGSSLNEKQIFVIFLGFFLTGIMSLNYGQFVFMWESCYFDTILANKISVPGYLKSKWILFAVMNLINFILCLPYGFLLPDLWLVSTSLFIYNTGITSIIMLLFGTLYRSPIDIGKSTFMNYEGTNAFQFLMVGVLLGLPYLILLVFKIMGIAQYCYYAYLILGISGIIFRDFLLKFISRILIKNKYRMSAGFRNR